MSQWTDSPNIIQRANRKVMALQPVTWILSHTVHRIDRLAMRASGGRATIGGYLSGLPIITLVTTGAKSGLPRSVPLVGIPDGPRLILIASNWGQDRHPAWYYNVKANPNVMVTRAGKTRNLIARELSGDEREAGWARAVTLYPGYRGYMARAKGRVIPVIALEPTGEQIS